MNRPAKVAIVAGVFILGIMIGGSGDSEAAPKVETRTVTQQVTKEVTPQSCKDIIDLDNQMFTRMGQALGNIFDTDTMNSTAQYIRDNTAHRTALGLDCLGK